MPGRLDFVVAGDTRAQVESQIGEEKWSALSKNGFANGTSVGFVGFHHDIKTDSLIVVLPKAFSTGKPRASLSDSHFKREQIYRLIRIFNKVRRETKINLFPGTSNKQTGKQSFVRNPVLESFEAALKMRREFRENGIYIKKTGDQKLNNPKRSINWQKTIRLCPPIIDSRNILFRDTYHRVRIKTFRHPLCLLHLSCLQEIYSLTGERHQLSQNDLLEDKVYQRVKSNPQAFLRSLKASIFDERGRTLVNLISAYLNESSLLNLQQEIREELLTYTNSFEYIWEKVLRDLISPGQIDRSLPVGRWHNWLDASAAGGIAPEYDIRLKMEDADILLDAKDYRLLNGSKWQDGGDHYKQIIYRYLLNDDKNPDIINILAFPGFGQNSLFEIDGCHDWKEIPRSRVFHVFVDYDLAVKRWLGENTLDVSKETENLINKIRDFESRVVQENRK
jgi:hypothetical protein